MGEPVFQQYKARHLRKIKILTRRMLRSKPFKARDSKEFINQGEAARWAKLQKKYAQKINKNAEDALDRVRKMSANSFRDSDNISRIALSFKVHEKMVIAGLRMAKAYNLIGRGNNQKRSEDHELTNAAKHLLDEAMNFHLGLLKYTIHVEATSPEGDEGFGEAQFNAYRDIAVKDFDKKMKALPGLLGDPDWKPPQRLLQWREALSQVQSGGSLKKLDTASIGVRAELSRMIAKTVDKVQPRSVKPDQHIASIIVTPEQLETKELIVDYEPLLEVESFKADFHTRHLDEWRLHSDFHIRSSIEQLPSCPGCVFYTG